MKQTLDAHWTKWSELPWMSKLDPNSAVIQRCHRLAKAALGTTDIAALVSVQLSEMAAEFSAQWAGLIRRTPDWQTVSEWGRAPAGEFPFTLLDEALDRDAGAAIPLGESHGTALVVPLKVQDVQGAVLVLAGKNVSADMLPAVLAVGEALSHAWDVVAARAADAKHVERLRTTLEIASSFASERESGPLLELIAREATRLLECERASIFIWDRAHNELVACPALGVEGGTLRIPDDRGIVGSVIHSGKNARVDNCYEDGRFSSQVDESSGYVTRNLLCWTLRDKQQRIIGAFEVMNKHEGLFTTGDEESLTQLAVQAAIAIENTREREQLIRSREQLTERARQGVEIIGESPAIAAMRSTVKHLAATDLPVLILGESGTGKEVVAQALHYLGPRAEHPFIAVNCAALTETLLESELFGHEKGAFTDAHEARRGKFELAEGGTLFLDEIGDMSLGGQAKLLRVLEQKVITRVGGSQAIPINVRVVAATNADLAACVAQRKFRGDLYYRLSVVTHSLPPLRERPEDILPLADHFLKHFCRQANRPLLKMSAEARRRLQAHAWPGNIRELRNLMERVAFLTQGDHVEAADLAFILSPNRSAVLEPSTDLGLTEATQEFQQDFIRRAINRVQGNMSEAARLLGLHRSNLYRKMRQLDMSEAEME